MKNLKKMKEEKIKIEAFKEVKDYLDHLIVDANAIVNLHSLRLWLNNKINVDCKGRTGDKHF